MMRRVHLKSACQFSGKKRTSAADLSFLRAVAEKRNNRRIRIPVIIPVLLLICVVFRLILGPSVVLGQSSVIFQRLLGSSRVLNQSSVTSVFILGDSSVNCGNNVFLYPFLQGISSSFSICNNSDRRFIPDLIVEKIGLPAVPLFYGQNGSVEGILRGLNFGSSPATIMTSASSNFQGLNQQLRQAFESLQLIELELGTDRAAEVLSGSLFYLSFGMDEFLQFFSQNISGVRQYGHREFSRLLVHQMARVVKDLYAVNVRKIVCMGIGPLGCAPRVRWENHNFTGNASQVCVNEFNKVVAEYNSMLSSTLIDLSSNLTGATIVFCDIYLGMQNIMKDPQSYGFVDWNSACCGLGRFGAMVGCVSKEMVCVNPEAHVWWDLYNPSQEVNMLLADWIWSGLPVNICHPISIKQLVSTSAYLHVIND